MVKAAAYHPTLSGQEEHIASYLDAFGLAVIVASWSVRAGRYKTASRCVTPQPGLNIPPCLAGRPPNTEESQRESRSWTTSWSVSKSCYYCTYPIPFPSSSRLLPPPDDDAVPLGLLPSAAGHPQPAAREERSERLRLMGKSLPGGTGTQSAQHSTLLRAPENIASRHCVGRGSHAGYCRPRRCSARQWLARQT